MWRRLIGLRWKVGGWRGGSRLVDGEGSGRDGMWAKVGGEWDRDGMVRMVEDMWEILRRGKVECDVGIAVETVEKRSG